MLIRALQAAAGNFGVTGYAIDNSLRFNDNDSAYLSRTPATTGNRKTWTWSGWVKRGNINSAYFIFTANIAAGDESFEFTPANTLRLRDGNSATTLLETSALFSDPSGWYHIILIYDSANSTGAIYVNGVQQSLSTNNISLNRDSAINNNVLHHISGYVVISASYFDGYLAEINFIDGQALTPDDFGEINATTGEWSPKAYSGTYGTNGFYLPFDGNANDDSGNGNNWTENNLASTDYMIDTPTNNFSVLNPLKRGGEIGETVSEGNLKYDSGVNDENYVGSGVSVSSGKWYFEAIVNTGDTHGVFGFTDVNISQSTAKGTNPLDLGVGGMIRPTLEGIQINSTFTSVSVDASNSVGVALDADTGEIWFSSAGNWISGDPALGTSPSGTITGITDYMAFASNHSGSSGRVGRFTLNFGADSSFAGNKTHQGNTDANGIGDFYYEPPAGYLALCENNLPTSGVVASGGTETTIIDGGRYYKVHTFTSSDTFTVSSGGEVEYLVVAGGGGGYVSGAGAGGYRSSVVGGLSGGGSAAESPLNVSVSTISVVVGAAGVGHVWPATPDYNTMKGGDSSLGSLVSLGGQGGGSPSGGPSVSPAGGSGGGAGGSAMGGAGTSGQGSNGGAGAGTYRNGGGGGAGQAGGDATTSAAGDGGDGLASTITGASVLRGGGGGGQGTGWSGATTTAGSGGSGGGGIGGSGGGAGGVGSANTGGGGGGGSLTNAGTAIGAGGNGGSGIVIIRYTV